MEYVYTKFESYDFEGDDKFNNGLKTLQTSGDSIKTLDIRLFFYNRFVEPIDSEGYKVWRERSTVAEKQTSLICDTDQLQNFKHLAITDSNCVNIASTIDGTTNTDAPLSFAEVMRLVEAGEEIPGLSKIYIKPSNESPTPSQLVRRLKPWEKTLTSK